MSVPTPTELRATLVMLVAGATETGTARWEKLIGEVEYLSLAIHPRCNWRVELRGGGEDRCVLDMAVELLRGEHPYITRGRSPGAETPGPAHVRFRRRA